MQKKSRWRTEDKRWILGISIGCFLLSLCSALLIFFVKPKVPALINPTPLKSVDVAGRAAFLRLRPLLSLNSRLTLVSHREDEGISNIIHSLARNVTADPKLSHIPLILESESLSQFFLLKKSMNAEEPVDSKDFRVLFQRVQFPFISEINCKDSSNKSDKAQCFIEQIMNSYAPKKWQNSDGVFSLHQLSMREFLFLVVQK